MNTSKEYMNLIGECTQLARQKGIKNLAVILNERYSLPYLGMLPYGKLVDFKQWLEDYEPRT